MATLGEELRAAREKRGLTLEQIAETTRISHTFLKALEENDYEVIPGEVFVTGFLRSYARELGLDENQVLARYREAHPVPKEEAHPEPMPEAAKHTLKPTLTKIRHIRPGKKSPLYMIIMGGLLLGAMLTLVTVLLMPKEEAVTQRLAAKGVGTPKPAQPPEQLRPSSTSFQAVTAAERPAAPTPPPTKAESAVPSMLILKLKAKDDTSYVYRADGGRRVKGLMKKGEVLDITAKESIVITVGNGGAVSAEYNGRRLGALGKEGEPTKNLLFTKEAAGVPAPAATPRGMPLRTSHRNR